LQARMWPNQLEALMDLHGGNTGEELKTEGK
jgi:hypothetical protein